MSSKKALSLAPQVIDAEQTLFLEPYIGHGLLGDRGSGHAPVTQAADAVLDDGLERHTEIRAIAFKCRQRCQSTTILKAIFGFHIAKHLEMACNLCQKSVSWQVGLQLTEEISAKYPIFRQVRSI